MNATYKNNRNLPEQVDALFTGKLKGHEQL
jgi:hypothetical protein